MSGGPNPGDLLRLWSESARYWEKYSESIATMFAPISEAMIEDARIFEGQLVLDIAGGAGDPSLAIARVCGPSGWVSNTDAIWEMVAVARRRAHRQGLSNLHFAQCLGDALPFGDDSFDAGVCRLGVMFFPDPVVSLREMLRVLKPGGQLSLAVWYGIEGNPFFSLVPSVLARHLYMTPVDPDAPAAFRFAERGKLAALVKLAGANGVRERVLEFRMEAPVSLRDFWTLRCEMSETIREKVKQLSPAALIAVGQEVQEAAREFFPKDRMSFPAQSLLVTGLK
ncbi:MAG TPA: class I SAM-dependent methyltransferase [Myxococcales bacterium]